MYKGAAAIRFTLIATGSMAVLMSLSPTERLARGQATDWRARIVRTFERANHRIHAQGKDRGPMMGTGALAGVLVPLHPLRAVNEARTAPGWRLHLGWVGDLRAYGRAPGQPLPRQLTEDQPIYRSNLGLRPTVPVHYRVHDLPPGALILFCSDGLIPKALNLTVLGRLLRTSAVANRDRVAGQARAIVGEGLRWQGKPSCTDADNITVLLAQLPLDLGPAGMAPAAIAGASSRGGRPDNQDDFDYSRGGPPHVLVAADGMSKLEPNGDYAPQGKTAANMAKTLLLTGLGGSDAEIYPGQ